MELDPLSIALEILNFLVLLWLLKRFLYKPVRAAIAQRQLTLEQGLKDAQLREQQAAAQEREYARLQEDWRMEQARQQAALQQQLANERDIALEKSVRPLPPNRNGWKPCRPSECDQREQSLQKQAVQSALQLTTRLLQRVASESLDRLLLNMLREDLAHLEEEERAALQESLRNQQGVIIAACAHPLDPGVEEELQTALSEPSGNRLPWKPSWNPRCSAVCGSTSAPGCCTPTWRMSWRSSRGI
ncbi:MAG: hypothetical protein R3F38_10545 [Gammaproteobacteria bacterium]